MGIMYQRRDLSLILIEAMHYVYLFLEAAVLHTQDRGHCDCCDRDVWRHLRFFIGHDNNNNNFEVTAWKHQKFE
ncbi:hypothetical protein LAZ67_2005210 [Cordylochernes scorpioides]|uniref:Uncharacterized protein n=1 Tax=Cordylochernes scorpioides TaxID=51811 RepID=A0ABY6K8S6_9ARAC|nr:hypothetical protein LAZ67_2005210 [Cordylochernes scorpioides]